MGKQVYRVLLLAVLTVLPLCVTARVKLPKTVIRSWSFTDHTAVADTIKVDSSFINLPMRNVQYDHSILNHYNGNLISPLQSALYFYRTRKTESIFATPYDIYTVSPQDVRFYSTTRPYSSIGYNRGFTTYHEDHDLNFDFTGNLNSKTNIGATIKYLDAAGHYKNQAGKTVNGSLFGSYTGTHYSLYSAFTFNQLSNFENGGLQEPTDLQNQNMETADMPVRLNAMSGFRYLSGYLNHAYHWTVRTTDSIEVPVLTIRHVFDLYDANKRYVEKTANQSFYTDNYINQHETRDTAALLNIDNSILVTFEEAFNRHLRFGITAWVRNQTQRHINNSVPNYSFYSESFPQTLDLASTSLAKQMSWAAQTWSNNLFVGGAIHKQTGNYIRYRANGEVCLVGRKLGEFNVEGNVGMGFKTGKDSLTIGANVFVRNEVPDFFLQHYSSNHYQWNNNFRKIYRFRVGGEVAYPSEWFALALKVNYETVKNMIYFSSLSAPQQTDQTVNVLSGDLTANLTTPWVNLDNHIVYQYSSSYIVPVPTLTLYHNLYYHGTWFKALDAQLGVDVAYNTAYYAPYLNPALGQFVVQQDLKVGNYPRINVYANFYVRLIHLNFFIQYQHLNATFMNRQYFSMPYYPTNPNVIRAGLAFRFYN